MTAPTAPGEPQRSGEEATDRRFLTARRIAELVGGRLEGDGEVRVYSVAPIERAIPGSLTFLGNARYAPALAQTGASVALVSPDLADAPSSVQATVVVKLPQEALVRLLPLLYTPPSRTSGVDATVRIGRGARIGQGVSIAPFVVIGDGASIGDRVRLDAHCVVGDGVAVGDDSHLYPHVTLYPGTELGARVIVHAGARLGSDGFGYVYAEGAHQKVQHVGRCVVEDDVEIGANTTIDRGSIDDTVIGAGTKIDNLVQVGHNVRIGRLCLIVSQAGIAGSARIGDGCVIGGQAGVAGHLSIADGARLAARGAAFGDIPPGETWSGYPARPHAQSLRAQAALFRLSAILKKVERLVGGTS